MNAIENELGSNTDAENRDIKTKQFKKKLKKLKQKITWG